jgi:hypothetical protein
MQMLSQHPWIVFLAAVVFLVFLTLWRREVSEVFYRTEDLAIGINWTASAQVFMRCLVTVSILAVSLYLILHHGSDAEQQKWAYGAVGTILGYWLKA